MNNNIYTYRGKAYPKELRWWFEKWKPKHGQGCDCRACWTPTLCLVKGYLLMRDRRGEPRAIHPSFDFGYCRARAQHLLKLLSDYGFAHPCHGSQGGGNAYCIGPEGQCKSPDHQP